MESDLTKTKPSHTAGKHANPWKQWIARANRGDEGAALNFFAGVEPIVREFCRIPYFRDNLGTNEIYGISNHKMTEFLKRAPHIRTDEEAPCVLKTVLRNTLLECEAAQAPLQDAAVLHYRHPAKRGCRNNHRVTAGRQFP